MIQCIDCVKKNGGAAFFFLLTLKQTIIKDPDKLVNCFVERLESANTQSYKLLATNQLKPI